MYKKISSFSELVDLINLKWSHTYEDPPEDAKAEAEETKQTEEVPFEFIPD